MPIIRTHSRSLAAFGSWSHGFALDRYSGSVLGTLVHRLKYDNDAGSLVPIVDSVDDFIRNRWQDLPSVDCIVPAPPSLDRIGLQPGIEIARAVAARLSVRFTENAVSKVEPTPPMKNIFSICERRQLLRKAIQKGPEDVKDKSVLVIDDVTQSGSTLGRISDVLLKDSGASEVYVLAVVDATNY
jgi:predicted amidophosphoribosyltransferase